MSDWSKALSSFTPETGAHDHPALEIDELLLFEQGAEGRSGVDWPAPPLAAGADSLGGLRRRGPIGLPGLSEPQVIRHFTRLSQKNYGKIGRAHV